MTPFYSNLLRLELAIYELFRQYDFFIFQFISSPKPSYMHLNLHIQMLKKSLISFTVVTNDHGYVPLVVNTSRSFPHSRLITGFVTRLARRVPLVKQELPTLPEHLSSSPVFSGFRVTRSLVLCVCFVDRCLSFCTFSFVHCVIYGFLLPLWYLQTLLRFSLVVRSTRYRLKFVSSLWQVGDSPLYH